MARGKNKHAARSTDSQGPAPRSAGATASTPLPDTRAGLLALHAETRQRRNDAEPGGREQRDALELLARIEVEIARIERSMNPPIV